MLKDKKAAILVADVYQELEYWYPYYRLLEAGAQVVSIGPEPGTYKSKLGYPAKADIGAATARPEDFDTLVIPGGYAPDRLRTVPELVHMTKVMVDTGKVVGAICHGGWLLCSARAVSGKRVTSVSAIRDDLENAGATWVDEPVVRDWNLITSRVPSDLPVFMREILAALASS